MTRYPRSTHADTSTRDGRDPQRRRQAPLFERLRVPGPFA